MVHYKLLYFDIRFLAEIARQILAYGGQEFEDQRITDEEWPEIKPTVPFGTVPVLYVDGKPIAQSHAIARYLAKKFNISGKNAWDEA